MRFYPFFTEQFLSPLTPAEVLSRVRNNTLSIPNDSWHDTFEVAPAWPFQGIVSADSFQIERISVLRIRHAQPPPIRGDVKAALDGQGSVVHLAYHLQPMAAMIVVGALVLAAAVAGLSIAKQWPRIGTNSLLYLFYFALPTATWLSLFIQLKAEANKLRPFMTELLRLKPRKASAA